MARTRYTEKALCQDIKEINATLAGTGYFLRVNPRNGMCAVDLHRVTDSKVNSVCVRNIQLGSPRECYNASVDYQTDALADHKATQANHKSPFGPM